MAHLDVDRIIDALTGRGAADDRSHIEECSECRAELEVWQQRLRGLRELDAAALDSTELHRLRTLFRQLGPSPERSSWIARLVRTSEPEPDAVPARGALSSSFEEYRAGSWSLVIQIRPATAEDRFDIHGQLTGDDKPCTEGADAVLVSDSGFGGRARLDAYGEFRFVGIPAGAYRASWLLGDGRIDLEGLSIGELDDESER